MVKLFEMFRVSIMTWFVVSLISVAEVIDGQQYQCNGNDAYKGTTK